MIRTQRRYWALAASLSAVAGFIDAVAFIKLGGFFVSFMSGNTTRLGVGLAEASEHAAIAGSLIAAFVLGVMLGAFVRGSAAAHGPARVLACVTALLAAAALLGQTGAGALAVFCLAAAMGAENSVFQRDGEVSVGLTYMTGTLVKLGQRLAGALTGGARFAWAPYLMLWSGLAAGAVLGALAYGQFALNAIWFAAAATSALAVVSYRLGDAVD